MTTADPSTATPATRLGLRPATAADVPICAAIWRDALNDYMGRLGLPPIPDELAPIRRLHGHLFETDPERFWVASVPRSEPVAFVAAVQREPVWFLSMLFVRPGEQGSGLGRALLGRVLPDAGTAVLATATDSAQPISNGLYASLGIVPRVPLLSLIGRLERPEALPELPAAIAAVPDDGAAPSERDALDREVAGFAHPQDHGWLRAEGRRAWLYREPDGRLAGYGYASEVGRVGPVAVRDAALLAPVVGHLLRAVTPRGASAVWAPGAAGPLVEVLLRAGLRLDGFPVLLCWDRPFADFGRYVPISPGLL